MKETRGVNRRWAYIPFIEKVSRELRLPIERVNSFGYSNYKGGGWYEYTYETDIPWEYR